MRIFDYIKEKFLNKQFMTFALIGVINTLDSLLIYALIQKNMDAGVASVVADAISIVGSYYLNTYFTYHQKPSLESFVKFPVSYIPGTIIAALVTKLIVDILRGPKIWAKAISLPLTFPLNYLVMTFLFEGGKK